MIIDNDIPKGVALLKVPERGERASFQPRAADFVPIYNQSQANDSIWQADAVISEYWTRNAVGPSAPLPDGSRTTYHVQREPRSLAFTGVLSDYPFLPSGVPAILPSSAPLVAANATRVRRSTAAFATLQAWYDERTLVAAIGPFEALELAYISSLTVPRSADDGMGIIFEITLDEVRTYDIESVDSIDRDAVKLGAMTALSGGFVVRP